MSFGWFVAIAFGAIAIGIALGSLSHYNKPSNMTCGGVIGAVVGGLLLLIVWFGYFASKQECQQTADAMHRDWKYGFYTGCLIQDSDRYIPLERWIRNEEINR